MLGHILAQAEFLVRILLAAVCGGIIGYERTNRGKGAGIRTHIIVAIASSLMMIISKYGFEDLPIGEMGSRGADPSRIAAQIVSGVGFLGAGMIFIQKQSVKGLTTAAGIWATAGIGMAIGSGMYTLGILTSLVILIVQVILHKKLNFTHVISEEKMSFVISDSEESIQYLKDYLSGASIQIVSMGFRELPDSALEVNITAALPHEFDVSALLGMQRDYVKSVSM